MSLHWVTSESEKEKAREALSQGRWWLSFDGENLSGRQGVGVAMSSETHRWGSLYPRTTDTKPADELSRVTDRVRQEL